jgi:hypothetical protein
MSREAIESSGKILDRSFCRHLGTLQQELNLGYYRHGSDTCELVMRRSITKYKANTVPLSKCGLDTLSLQVYTLQVHCIGPSAA